MTGITLLADRVFVAGDQFNRMPPPGQLQIVSTFANQTFPNPSTDYVEPLYGDAELLLSRP